MKKLAAVLAISAALFMTGGCGSSGGSSNNGGWYGPVTPENTSILVTKGGENTAYVEADATSAVFKFRLNEKWTVNEALRGADNSLVKFTPDSGNGNDNIVTASFPVNDGNTERIYDIPIYSGSNGRQISNVKIVQKMTPKEKAWLYMTYIAGDNNLTQFQLDNLRAMESVGSDDSTHMTAFIDIGEAENIKGTDWEGKLGWKDARAFYITKSESASEEGAEKAIESELIKDYGKVDSGSKETLEKFLTETMKNYPAQHTVLIFNDHGGAYAGALQDDETSNVVSCRDMKQAILNAEKATGKKIDIIGFDACLMASFESLYELRDTADYFCVSEENIGGPGWDYEALLNMAQDSSLFTDMLSKNTSFSHPALDAIKKVQEIKSSKIAADVTPEQFGFMTVAATVTRPWYIKHMSCIKASDLEVAKDAIDKLALAIISECENDEPLKAETLDLLTKTAEGSDAIEYGGGFYGLYDFITILESLHNSSSEEIRLTADEAFQLIVDSDLCVAYHNAGLTEIEYYYSRLFSIYVKAAATSYFPEAIYMDNEFANKTSWVKMLRTIGAIN